MVWPEHMGFQADSLGAGGCLVHMIPVVEGELMFVPMHKVPLQVLDLLDFLARTARANHAVLHELRRQQSAVERNLELVLQVESRLGKVFV